MRRPEQCPDDYLGRSTDHRDQRPQEDIRQINPFDLPFDDDYAETFYQNRPDDTPSRTPPTMSEPSRRGLNTSAHCTTPQAVHDGALASYAPSGFTLRIMTEPH